MCLVHESSCFDSACLHRDKALSTIMLQTALLANCIAACRCIKRHVKHCDVCEQDSSYIACSAEGLAHISNYLATLGFADVPDYALLEHHLQSIPDMHPPAKHSYANGTPVETTGYAPEPVLTSLYPPPSSRYPEAYPSTSSLQAEAPWQQQVCLQSKCTSVLRLA